MDKKTFESRVRQLLAIDMGAVVLYEDMAKITEDKILKKQFSGICEDEKRHTALSQQILSLLKE